MAAKKTQTTDIDNKSTTRKTATAKTSTKKTTTKKQPSKKGQPTKKVNSTVVLLVIILVLLGFIAYTYRDKLQVAFDWMTVAINNADKQKTSKKTDKKSSLEKSIEKLDQKSKKSTTTTTVAKKKFDKVTTTTTTTTIKKRATTTTTTTTVKKNVPTTTTTTVAKRTTTTTVATQTHTAKIYFTKVTDDKLYLCSVNRTVNYKDAPLTETLRALLKGPTASEDAKDIVTNIPDGTRLLSATVKNGIAYLNFSTEFENNYYGKEATIYQLEQIVYTATEFANIKAVQFLVGGQKEEYLGGEGIVIGEPLGRNDF